MAPVLQLIVPEELRSRVVAAHHEGKNAHPSAIRTFQAVSQRFYWPGMLADIRRYQKYCPVCQYDKKLRKKHAIAGHIVALRPGSVWVVDIMKMPKAEDGSEWVLVCVDAFSRYVEVAALKDKTSATVTSALVSCILAGSGGMADCIISDQGSEFHGFLMELLKML